MKIGICDDQQIFIDNIIENCERLKEELGVELEYLTFLSGEEVLDCREDVELLFLDVEMKGINGIDTMHMLEDYENVKNILFVSSYSDYVFEVFGTKTRGFVCKPVEYDDFARNVKKVLARKENSIVEILVEGEKVFIKVDSIIYISGASNYMNIITTEKNYNIYGRLKDWEEELERYCIIRVHKSYMVNLEYVSQIRQNIALKSVNEQVPIGRKYKDIFKQKYNEYVCRKFRRM